MDSRKYLNFEPVTEWIHEKDIDILLLSLPDFRKEQLRIQIGRSPRTLKISGERPIVGNKWNRFSKEFPVSANCDITKLNAQFRDGILYVQQPKLIISLEKNKPNDSSNNNEPPQYQKPKDDQEKLENKPATNQPHKPKDDQEKIENKPSGSNEPLKFQKPKDDQLQKKNQETRDLDKDGQSELHKTNQETGQTTTKPKDDQLTQIQKGDQETAQITNPMGKLMDQKLGNAFGDFPKKETIAKEVPEKSSSKGNEIVGDEKNERNYDEDEYDRAINRAMKVGQPSRWTVLVLVVLFIALVWFHLMDETIEGSKN